MLIFADVLLVWRNRRPRPCPNRRAPALGNARRFWSSAPPDRCAGRAGRSPPRIHAGRKARPSPRSCPRWRGGWWWPGQQDRQSRPNRATARCANSGPGCRRLPEDRIVEQADCAACLYPRRVDVHHRGPHFLHHRREGKPHLARIARMVLSASRAIGAAVRPSRNATARTRRSKANLRSFLGGI